MEENDQEKATKGKFLGLLYCCATKQAVNEIEDEEMP